MMKTVSGVIIDGPGFGPGIARPARKTAAAACIGLCLLILTGTALGAEVKPEIRYVYYDVPYNKGVAVSELIRLHTTLFNNQGRPLAGITDYLIRYEMNQGSRVPGICHVENPKVFCECEITLPRLVGEAADPLIRSEFATELESIRRHELTHCDIAVRYADTLLTTYHNFNDMLCESGAETVRKEFERVIAECWEAQLLFDHSEYGYQDHLDAGDFKRAVGDNYQISPQTQDGSRPGLKPSAPPRAPAPRREPLPAPPLRVETVPSPAAPPAEAVRPGPETPREGSIFKDKDGVWRNY